MSWGPSDADSVAHCGSADSRPQRCVLLEDQSERARTQVPLVRTEVLVFIGSLGIWASFLFSKRPTWSRKYLKRGAFVSLPLWTPQSSVCCSRSMTHVYNFSHFIRKHHPSASSWDSQAQAQSHLLQEGFLNAPGSTSGCQGVINSATYHAATFNLVSFPDWFSHFSCKFCVGWTQHLLLLSHDSFATQNGFRHQALGSHGGACLNQNLLPHPRYRESESVSQQAPCLTRITGGL